MDRVTELRCRWCIGIIGAQARVVGVMAVSFPTALGFSCVRIENDYSMIAVAIGNVKLICILVDKHLCGTFEVLKVVAPFALARMADLHQEFSVLRELQDHVVIEWPTAGLRFI